MKEMMSGSRKNTSFDGKDAPDPEEVDMDPYGKRIPKLAALFPPRFIFTRVNFIRECNLFLIVCWKEPNLCIQLGEVGGCDAI